MTDERTGGCVCGAVRYRLKREPMITHCCHCSWCQRETGSAFVLNAVIEASEIDIEKGAVVYKTNPSASGRGQEIARCAGCHTALWSHYSVGRPVSFVRAGTLDNPNAYPPDVHIYTSTRLGWVTLPEGANVFPEYYSPSEVWRPEARLRWKAALAS